MVHLPPMFMVRKSLKRGIVCCPRGVLYCLSIARLRAPRWRHLNLVLTIEEGSA